MYQCYHEYNIFIPTRYDEKGRPLSFSTYAFSKAGNNFFHLILDKATHAILFRSRDLNLLQLIGFEMKIFNAALLAKDTPFNINLEHNNYYNDNMNVTRGIRDNNNCETVTIFRYRRVVSVNN